MTLNNSFIDVVVSSLLFQVVFQGCGPELDISNIPHKTSFIPTFISNTKYKYNIF